VYATVAELRDEGVTPAMASDSRLARLVDEASAAIDRVTGWFFEPRDRTLRLSGRGTSTLELPIPPIAIARLELAYEADATPAWPAAAWAAVSRPFDASTMVVVGAPLGPTFDGARITLRHGLRFPRGRGNVVVEGVWGYTEEDGTPQGRTPLAIRRACMLLVLRNVAPLADDAAFEARARWRIVEERTRDQSYRLDPSRTRVPVLTGDPDVDLLLAPYVRPSFFGAA
jgi:hypothetical protein